MEVSGEMQVDVLHRHHLRVSATRRAALDAKAGPKGGLAQTAHGLLADAVQSVTQTDCGRGLAFARRRRRNGSYQNESAVLISLHVIDEIERHLGLVGPVIE